MMTLKEILEEQSVKSISKKTNISEENIERLIAEDFTQLAKAKALGFISIVERDLGADMKTTKEKAIAYYAEHPTEERVHIVLPRVEEKKGRSKLFLLLMLGLLAYASWYFFTQFNKKTLTTMLPFKEEKSPEIDAPSFNDEMNMSVDKEDKAQEASLSLTDALTSSQADEAGVQTDIVVANLEPKVEQPRTSEVQTEADKTPDVNATGQSVVITQEATQDKEITQIVLKPRNKLWFGIIDMDSGKRDNHVISNSFMLDVKEKSWLVATSSAAFSFINDEEIQEYNDAKEHYFKVSKAGINPLNRTEYITLGGYKKW